MPADLTPPSPTRSTTLAAQKREGQSSARKKRIKCVALVNVSCADSILVESILRESDQQKGFHAAKTLTGHWNHRPYAYSELTFASLNWRGTNHAGHSTATSQIQRRAPPSSAMESRKGMAMTLPARQKKLHSHSSNDPQTGKAKLADCRPRTRQNQQTRVELCRTQHAIRFSSSGAVLPA
jgi:hypothetical protein